ncbi:Hypothetical protein PSF113_0537 [Pseudomonas ogarae]|nr:Hypothetical protein PSF113_0537 [Pseudomonas ogarae]
MFKATPNPPETDPSSAHAGLDPHKLDEAAKRVIDHYLDPKPQPKKKKPQANCSLSRRAPTPKPS